MAIDFQGLFKVLRAGEKYQEENRLIMQRWECDTAGCLIGSFCRENKEDSLKLKKHEYNPPYPVYKYIIHIGNTDPCYDVAARFGISYKEACFLFSINPLHDPTIFRNIAIDAIQLNGADALKRLRKFLYYKLHKQEMEYEEARRVDGNKAAIHAAEADNTELPVMYNKLLGVS